MDERMPLILVKSTVLNVWIALILSVLIVAPAMAQDEIFNVGNVRGDALVRPAGEYFWRYPAEGQAIEAGDRVRLRTGHIDVHFPQGLLRMDGPGEMEIPVDLADGIAEPWKNDIQLYIGQYNLEFRGERLLKVKTLFAEVLSTQAEVRIDQQLDKVVISVISGNIVVCHLRRNDLISLAATDGQSVVAGPGTLQVFPSDPSPLR